MDTLNDPPCHLTIMTNQNAPLAQRGREEALSYDVEEMDQDDWVVLSFDFKDKCSPDVLHVLTSWSTSALMYEAVCLPMKLVLFKK